MQFDTKEVQALKLGQGEVFEGEGILAVTKAALQAGVSYVGGYQGSPVSHLVDVLSEAKEIMDQYGVHLEICGNEAGAAASWLVLHIVEDLPDNVNADSARAAMDGGKTAEVRLKRFPGYTAEPVVIKNLRYFGAPRNDGFVMMKERSEWPDIGERIAAQQPDQDR